MLTIYAYIYAYMLTIYAYINALIYAYIYAYILTIYAYMRVHICYISEPIKSAVMFDSKGGYITKGCTPGPEMDM